LGPESEMANELTEKVFKECNLIVFSVKLNMQNDNDTEYVTNMYIHTYNIGM